MDSPPLYPLSALREIGENLPQCRQLGLECVELGRGRCELRMPWDERRVGNPDTGTLHGGAITTLMDTAGGSVAFSVIEEGATVATLDLRIDYLRQNRPREAIHAIAEVVHRSRNVAFVRGHAFHPDTPDQPLANLTASFMVGSVGFSPGGAS